MKKIINGKVYDTEKATQVGTWDNNYYPRDFDYVCETLYRKRTGEYFIYGIGGAKSKYSVSCGQNSWSGGEKIIPVAYENAKKWAEEKIDTEEYEKEFGQIQEDETSETITISIPASAAARLRRAAQEKGIGLSAYIASLSY